MVKEQKVLTLCVTLTVKHCHWWRESFNNAGQNRHVFEHTHVQRFIKTFKDL